MSLTPSNMFPLQTKAPSFSLLEPLTGKKQNLQDCSGARGTVVIFMCNHCPFVIHVLDGIVEMANDYLAQGIGFVAINSNDVRSYPADAPDKMVSLVKSRGLPFPYLYDESQVVAKAYEAACTPDFYLFDSGSLCVYRGQMDGARPGNNDPVTGRDLRAAMDALLSGSTISAEQYPSIGCNIKWKR
ncbi:MAG: thiol-disulfide isomerase/thioredoxin [Lentisphaeria bacterium]|jgi:thiol-disulfide isomerase/thioredoxin